MTTKPSDAPWADAPYKLITTPLTYRDVNSHSAVYCASEMAYSHNCILRGLNAIIQQAPYVKSSNQDGYVAQDVKDLMFYTISWNKATHWHHHTEETIMFPEIEKMANKPGLLSGPLHQHEAFQKPMDDLQAYAEKCQDEPASYRWESMKVVLDDLGPPLSKHLYEEIDVFLSFDKYDSVGLRKCWDLAEDAAKGKGEISFLYDMFPCVLGTCDKTYEGGNQFPPLPGFMPYAIKYWFGAYHPGAWRFNPCDFWGKPKPLGLLPENVKATA